MPQTRSQSSRAAPKSKPRNKKGFIDDSPEDAKETARAMQEVRKMCKKLETPKIKPQDIEDDPDFDTDAIEDPDTEPDPDFDPDLEAEEITAEDLLAAIEEGLREKVGDVKFAEYIDLKSRWEKSQPNFTQILEFDATPEDKVELIEQFLIYLAEPVGQFKLEQKKKLLYLLKPVPAAIRQLKQSCPDVGDDIEQKIVALQTIDANKIVLYQKYQLYHNAVESDEKNSLESWFRLALSLPYEVIKPTPIEKKIKVLADELDRRLYGMQNFKNHILVEINRYLHNPKNTRNIALKGPPGIGKTSVIKILSESIGVPFYAINAGGIDVDSLIGCNFAYRGAHEGEITRALRSFGQSNGFIYFDEYDKIGGDGVDSGSRDSAAVQAELIRITDKTQNFRFKDLYLMGLEQTLANVLFFFSMNATPRNTAMLDRLTVIEMDGYSQKDKIAIAKRHLIPDALAELGLSSADIVIEDAVIHKIAVALEEEKGVRQFQNTIHFIINQIYFLMTNTDVETPLKNIPLEPPIIVNESIYDTLKKSLNLEKKWLSYFI